MDMHENYYTGPFFDVLSDGIGFEPIKPPNFWPKRPLGFATDYIYNRCK